MIFWDGVTSMLTPPNVPAVQCIACLLFAFLIPGGVSVSECGQWTPYHTPLLLTHPSAGSMVLVGTGTTASVEMEPGELG